MALSGYWSSTECKSLIGLRSLLSVAKRKKKRRAPIRTTIYEFNINLYFTLITRFYVTLFNFFISIFCPDKNCTFSSKRPFFISVKNRNTKNSCFHFILKSVSFSFFLNWVLDCKASQSLLVWEHGWFPK